MEMHKITIEANWRTNKRENKDFIIDRLFTFSDFNVGNDVPGRCKSPKTIKYLNFFLFSHYLIVNTRVNIRKCEGY